MSQRAESATRDTFRALERERRAIAGSDGETLALQLEIAVIPAPTGDEATRAAWISDRMRDAGLSPRTDEAGNVIARTPSLSANAPIVVTAHLDTVFPAGTPLSVRRDGARFVGPGIGDNGRGLAALLALTRVIAHSAAALERPVEFVATTGEEGAGDLRGARHYLGGSTMQPHALIALDGAGDDRIVHVALGSRRFRIGYRGPGGHSWTAHGTPNPVHAAARAAAALADLRLPRGTRSTLSVNRIGGGLSINSIPEDAWLEVDARNADESALARLERDIRDIATAAATLENDQRARFAPAVTLTVERVGARPGGETPDDSDLVATAIAATQLIGREPQLAMASTDANAAIALGVPAIAIGGGGRGGDTHTSHEWYENAHGAAGVERALTIVTTMARMAAD